MSSTTNFGEGPDLRRFKDILENYGLADLRASLAEAIRSSYLTAGAHPIDISEKEAGILRQIGIGWPILSSLGKAIGKELVDRAITEKKAMH
jgi:hypothetical protein